MNGSPSLSHLPVAPNELEQRLVRYTPGLRQKLLAVYGNHQEFDAWLGTLLEKITATAQQRSPALLALDQQREQDPDWFLQQDMLGYCTYVDRFAGDLQGVKQRIPHLVKLGVRYLHLLPFFRSRQGENDGGFAVASFEEVEPRLGTLDDLRELTSALREQKISLCADFVLNHVADDHPWALAAKAGNTHYQAFFHTFPDRQLPDQYEQTVGQIFPQAAPGNFSFNPEMQAWVWTTFYPYQWDLNYSNPQVFAEIVMALLGMANLGIEAFRLDSTAFLWKRLGTSCMNQGEAHLLLQALRDIIEIAAPGVLLKAEAIVATADLPAYLGNVDDVDDVGDEKYGIKECHIAYHSSLMAASWVALAEQNVELIQAVMRATPILPVQTSWLNYIRCHDDIGWNVLRAEAAGSLSDEQGAQQALQRLRHASQFYSGAVDNYADGLSFQASDVNAVHGTVGMAASLCGIHSAEAELAQTGIRRLMLMMGLALSFGGIPVLYMGDELAQMNDRSYQSDPAKKQDGRWLQRPYFDQDALTHLQDMHRTSSVVFQKLNELLMQRRELPCFAAHQPRMLLDTMNQQVLAFIRGVARSAEHCIYLGNFSEQTQTLASADIFAQLQNMQIGQQSDQPANLQYVDVLSGEPIGATIELPAYSQRWLRLLGG
ncbi:MAG: alpha-amylase family glycosyl hydrolase [Candidatus Aquirickettsiella gammari]